MAKIYTRFKNLSRKQRKLQTLKPQESTIQFLLNYSKALSVQKLPNGEFAELMLN
ncbi:MAG: hypothetical protein ACLGGV_04600 [Bacteroidia bacterium]